MRQNRWLTLSLLLLIIISVTFGCFFAFPEIPYQLKQTFASDPHPDPLTSELTNAFSKYESGEIPFVNLSTITTFDWDRLYIYGSYSSPFRELTSQFGWSWMSCTTTITLNDSVSFLVFVKGNVVVHCLDYGPWTGGYSFAGLASEHPTAIPVQDALFIMRGERYKAVYLFGNPLLK